MKVLELIINGSDFQTVLKEIIIEEGLDPWNIDLVKLSDSLLNYLSQLKVFNFRIPARFILVSSILLRLKSESLLKEELEKDRELETINIEGLETLEPPINRIPYRNLTFEELTTALEKVMDREKKIEKIRMNRQEKIEKLQKIMELDIEDYVDKVFRELSRINKISFYNLVKDKEFLETAKYFIALLYLANQQRIKIYQEKLFEDFNIELQQST
jgi:segregation and condensation protein A